MQKKLTKVLLILLAVSFVFVFFKKMKPAPEREVAHKEVYSNKLPEDFHTFYDAFHSDSAYQMSHIIFPLLGIKQVEKDSILVPIEHRWKASEWKLHIPFDSQGGTFERTFTNLNGIIEETIVGNGGMFSLQKRYSKITGEWHLIYFQSLMMHG